MKMMSFALAVMAVLSSPYALAEEKKPETPLELCKAKAAFRYHFDMMKIEGQEIRDEIPPSRAAAMKQARHMEYAGELAVCKDEHEN